MKMITIVLMIVAVLLVAGCTEQQAADNIMDDQGNAMESDGPAMETNGPAMEAIVVDDGPAMEAIPRDDMEAPMMDSFSGTILAGSTTPFIDFNKADYDKAVAEDKVILLYFYAEWCPVCVAELKETHAAFDELELTNVVGFRVNYKDSDVDDFEEQLAKDHGITYQHTKVIVKNGERIEKAPNSWDKEDYIQKLSDAQ